MEALAALLSRHSVAPGFLREPAPAGSALERILAAGAAAPDHGRLRPWRFIVIAGEARARLGELFASALAGRQPDVSEDVLAQERARPLRSPLIIAVAAKLQPEHPKIPVVEQIAATAAAAQNLLLAAHAEGFGGKWLTGPSAYDETVKAGLGLAASDQVIAFIHLGTVEGAPPTVAHAEPAAGTIMWQGPTD